MDTIYFSIMYEEGIDSVESDAGSLGLEYSPSISPPYCFYYQNEK